MKKRLTGMRGESVVFWEPAEALAGASTLRLCAGHERKQGMNIARDYQLQRHLSAGRDGVAYLARETASGEYSIYCKLNANHAADVTAIERVKRVMTLLTPGIIRPQDLRRDDGQAILVYDSWPKLTLHEFLTGNSHLSLVQFQSLADALVRTLLTAYRANLSHGSLCEHSLLIDAEGRLKLNFSGLKFGLAGEVQAGHTDDIIGLCQVLNTLLERTQMADDPSGVDKLRRLRWSKLIARGLGIDELQRPIIEDFEDLLSELRSDVRLPSSTQIMTPLEHHLASGATGDLDSLSTASSTLDVATLEGSQPQARAEASGQLGPGSLLGRYRVIQKLGEGGMGAVYQACQIDDGRLVAIKVLSRHSMKNVQAVRRFQKEARLLASINNPHITNLIEVGQHEDLHFLVLEFVSGMDLKKVLNQTISLEERQSLEVIADVCRALRDAHAMGMVHRDIKPENILVEVDVEQNDWKQNRIEGAYRVKLSDFGIARFIDQSESMAMTQAYALIGTPFYMSPEQFKGQGEITPQSDVYSLGVTLFELLTGKLPFFATDAMRLASMHCFDAIPLPSKFNPKVTSAVDEILVKALAKKPEDRYADAGHLLKAIERLLVGEVSEFEQHPILPTYDPAKLFVSDFEWNLQSSPEELWPFVSNTERFNRAVGIPAVDYKTVYDEQSGTRRFGSFKLAGLTISWEEHPFEWVEGKRMSVLRTFDKGPFKWFTSIVELERKPDGGTKLHHKVRIDPAGTFGKWLANFEVKFKSAKLLQRVYQRIDQSIAQLKVKQIGHDPFEDTTGLKSHQEKRLAQRLEKLHEAGLATDLVERFGDYLRGSSIQDLQKIRPLNLAAKLSSGEDETIDLCLHASSAGLLTLQWDILCPTCRVAADTRASLKELENHTHCDACHLDFRSDLANSIELVFRIHSDLQESRPGKYCIGGPWHAPHVVSQMRVRAGECVELELSLEPGEYLVRGQHLPYSVSLQVRNGVAPSHCEISFAATTDLRHIPVLRAGKQVVQIRNQLSHDRVMRIERTISRHDVITAARASAFDSFRRLFPNEVLRPEQLVSTEQVTLLMTGIANVDELYEQHGDAEACRQIQQALVLLGEQVRGSGGCVVKTVGEGLLAAYQDIGLAVQAAFALSKCLQSDEVTSGLRLRVGVHAGPAVVTTVNGRLDYFGGAARLAMKLPEQARELILTEAVFRDPLVSRWLSEQGKRGELASLKAGEHKTELIQHFTFSERASS